MTQDFIYGFIYGLITPLAAVFCALALAGIRRAGKTKKPDSEPAALSFKPPPRNPDSPHQWFSRPGGRIELGQSGFYITLNPDQPKKVYQGHSPEHHCIVWGNDLAGMKQTLEAEARERAEFEPPAGGWRQ